MFSIIIITMILLLRGQRNFWSVLNEASGAVVDNWCDLDTGPADLLDLNKQKHSVYASVARDGSVWVRLGLDHSPHMDWSLIERKKFRVQTPFLNDSEISLLQNLTYSDYCVVTDLDLQLNVASAWNPSFLTYFDPASKEVKILSLKNIRDCSVNTRISLTSNGQTLRCEGTRIGSCTFKNVPVKDPPTTRPPTPTTPTANTSTTVSPSWFIKYVSLDLHGPDYWICPAQEERSWYTFNGSYYHVYVKVDSCVSPNDTRALGDEVKLRREKDTAENMVLLPNPSQAVLAPGYVNAWQFFAKIVSLEHTVHLQIWRPQSHKPPPPAPHESITYRLIDQTFVHPRDLRVHEIVLERPFKVERGDVIGLYFPKFNPIGWSAVPCSDDQLQRHRYHSNPNRKLVQPGSELTFTMSSDSDGAPCRSYSVMAFFANKSHLKLLENWRCPSRTSQDLPGSTVSNKRSNIDWQKIDPSNDGTPHRDTPSSDPAEHPLTFWGYHSATHNAAPLTLVHAIVVLVTASLLVAMMVIGLVSYKLSVSSCVN